MIKFSLICNNEHEFEAWFSTGNDFNAQKKRGLVTCPYCASKKIEKSLMTPALPSGGKNITEPELSLPTSPQTTSLATNANMPENYSQVIDQMRKLRTHIEENSENVGKKFSEEARKIHYGEAEKRSIYGQANATDIENLVEEGVEILPLPILPEDKN